jgi:hypothetical protein
MDLSFRIPANKPAAPNAGIASRLTIGHCWPGVGELDRSCGRCWLHQRSAFFVFL